MGIKLNPLTGDFYIESGVRSVNGDTGPIVVLDAGDVGADPAGTAQTLFDILGEKYVRTTRFAIISSGTSGSVTLPSNSTVILDDFGGTTDAILSQVISGKPSYKTPQTSAGALIATSFDSSGNYILTGTPSSYPIAIVYRVRQTLENFDSTSSDIIGTTNFQDPIAGVNTQVIFNDNGNFGADSGLTFDKTTKKLTNTITALAATTATSHLLENSTAATTGSRIQVSPAIQWSGRGWKTNSVAASQSVDYRTFVTPVTATINPLAQWNLQHSVNGGAYTTGLSYIDKVQDGVDVGLFTAAGFQKITGANSSTVGTLQNLDIVNSGSRSHLTFRFGSTIQGAISTHSDGSMTLRSAGSGRIINFEVGSGIESTNLIAQIYTGGLYCSYAGYFGGVLTGGSADTNATAKLSSYGSFAVKGTHFNAIANLTETETMAYADPAGANVCLGTPTECSTYVSQGTCNTHTGVGCSWFSGNSCSGATGTDSGTCIGQGAGCVWEEVSCSGANNTDQTTCESQDDAYSGNCLWNTSTCPAIGDEGTCNGTTGCSWSTTCSGSPDQTTCTNNGCSWNFSDCTTDFLDEGSCNAQAGCSWNGSSCDGQYNTSCTGDTCTGNLCTGNYNNGNCIGTFGATCQGTANCGNLTDDGSVVCAAESGCTWTTGITLTLPAQTVANRSNTSRVYMIMNIGTSGSVTVIPNPSDSPTSTINGASSVTLSTQYSQVFLHHHNITTTCTGFTSQSSCQAQSGCTWNPLTCGSFVTEGSCNVESGCSWNFGTEACEGTYGGSGGDCSGTYISSRKWFVHNRIT